MSKADAVCGKRIFLVRAMLLLFLGIEGCGIAGQSGKEEAYSFQLEVEDVFELLNGGVVVVGHVQSGTMNTGDKAVLVKENGTELETGIVRMEGYDSHEDGLVSIEKADEGRAVGILLEGLEKSQVNIGDFLKGRGY